MGIIALFDLRSLSHGFLTTSILNVLLRLFKVSWKFHVNFERTSFVICLQEDFKDLLINNIYISSFCHFVQFNPPSFEKFLIQFDEPAL